MTDPTKFPDAIPATWSSGHPTVAISGATFLTGSGWGLWEGALAVAELKNAGVRILMLTQDGRVRAQAQLAALDEHLRPDPHRADRTRWRHLRHHLERRHRPCAAGQSHDHRAGLPPGPGRLTERGVPSCRAPGHGLRPRFRRSHPLLAAVHPRRAMDVVVHDPRSGRVRPDRDHVERQQDRPVCPRHERSPAPHLDHRLGVAGLARRRRHPHRRSHCRRDERDHGCRRGPWSR